MLFAANGHLGTLDLTADATGAVTDTVRSPKLSDFGAKPPRFDLDVTANDQSKFLPDGTIVGPPEDSFAFAKVTVSDWDVMVKSWDTNGPAHGKPQRRISLKAYGWTLDGSTLFAHYLRSGHVLRTVKVGSLAPPCGDLSTMMREFPFRPVPAGRYRVVFDASRVYSPAVANVYYSSVVVARKDAVR